MMAIQTNGETGRNAVDLWREKLNHLLTEEAKASDPSLRFDISKKIEEARLKIDELAGESKEWRLTGWGRFAARLPQQKARIQLAGLALVVAAFVTVRSVAPKHIEAQISAGAIGVTFIIFGQAFQFLHLIPSRERPRFLLAMFFGFLVFILALVTLIVILTKSGADRSAAPVSADSLGTSLPQEGTATPTYEEYVETFFDHSKKGLPMGVLFALNELETRQLKKLFADTTWNGGSHWGDIDFDESGRIATFTNQAGRSPGHFLIQGAPPGTVPVVLAEWHQEDGQKGRLILALDPGGNKNSMRVRWGPAFSAESQWKTSVMKGENQERLRLDSSPGEVGSEPRTRTNEQELLPSPVATQGISPERLPESKDSETSSEAERVLERPEEPERTPKPNVNADPTLLLRQRQVLIVYRANTYARAHEVYRSLSRVGCNVKMKSIEEGQGDTSFAGVIVYRDRSVKPVAELVERILRDREQLRTKLAENDVSRYDLILWIV